MGLFARARANQPLSPAERAILKFVDGLVLTFLAAALPILWQAFNAWQAGGALTMDWRPTLDNALKVGGAAVALAVWKYFKSLHDAVVGNGPVAQPASVAVETVEGKVAEMTGLPASVVGALVGQIVDAVGGVFDKKIAALPVSVAQPASDAVTQIAAFQAFALPAGHVAVQAPNGLMVAVPADALPDGGHAPASDSAPAPSPDAENSPVEMASVADAGNAPDAAGSPEVPSASIGADTLASAPAPDAAVADAETVSSVDLSPAAVVPPTQDAPVSASVADASPAPVAEAEAASIADLAQQ